MDLFVFLGNDPAVFVVLRVSSLNEKKKGANRADCPTPLASFCFNLQLTGLFQFTVRLLTETEARFTSVERINHYIKVRPLWTADYVAHRHISDISTPTVIIPCEAFQGNCLAYRPEVLPFFFFFHYGDTGDCMHVTSCAVGMLINTQPVMSAQSGKTEQRINSSCQTAKRYKCGLSFLSSRTAESRGRRRCVVCLSTSAYLTTLTEIPPKFAAVGERSQFERICV